MQALWMALGALFFAIMGVCIKLASQGYGTLEIVFYRGLTGVVLFSALLWLRGTPLATPVPLLHVRRNLAGITAMSLWFYAIGHLPFATSMTLNTMSSVWLGTLVIVAAWWKTRRIAYPWLFVAVLCGFVGVVLLLNPRMAGNDPLAALLGLISGMMSAVAYLQVSALGRAGEPETRTVFYFSLGTTLVGLVGVLLFSGFSPLEWRTAWLLPATGIFASLGQWCMTRAYTRGSTLVVATLQYLGIVYASLFSLWLFHERLEPAAWLGMVIIVLSGIAATWVRQHQAMRQAAQNAG
ncbi:DMT family transporter [Brachymonas denitrificans]|jgi:S-adenosylmethionine uptake transporter|uniref:S-adenosylmethionine uptake transporter n=1 Tax=Brachymonas denitrificans DSM 15123 TaxID=1121117 RepID=A0A1H8FSJ9_9BURK|nr:DMT family transporter [Brachymonas denitrificans]SEN34781.1 S-adenosylmethionine uptake transporter [Brachymonas denitrificans DSM 15123]